MRLTIKLPFILLAVFSFSAFLYGLPPSQVNVPLNQNVVFVDDDDEDEEVRARVARISALDGEAKIRRNGSDEWEKVSLNLPLVEGDEIATDAMSRVEIQFDKDKHLRLDGGSFLRFSTLKDEGIAVSLSLGKLSFLATSFDKARSFFEIDGPKVTIAVQKAGRYFVDAGEKGDAEVRVSIDEGGEARIYSESAGFTLKDQRTARIFIDGPNAGEWSTSAGVAMSDDFASWLSDRQEVVAQRLQNSYYDRYYDQDIYGADDLDDNGDWINTNDYGYVWRPSRLATAQYSNWTPYRYGHWRWMSPFGWVWVNDEPWGWATYHHGRWFMYNGGWVWSPYGYYRSRRSWWSPALVVINIYNNNVCWYPLSYHRRRHNFNAAYQKRESDRIVRNPRITPPGPGRIPPPGRLTNGKYDSDVPIGGIVTTDTSEFGKRGMRVRTAPEPIAKTILTKRGDEVDDPILPDFKDRRNSSDILTPRPKIDPVIQTRTGAGPKRTDRGLDAELQKTRIFGGRTPQKEPDTDSREPFDRSGEPRKTGAVDRPPVIVRQPSDPVRSPRDPEVVRQPSDRLKAPRDPEIIRQPPSRQPIVMQPPGEEKPRRTQPQNDEKPRRMDPVRETPRYDPPPRPVEKVRNDPPPGRQPPQRSDPPPSKSSPKEEPKAIPSRREKPDSL